MELGPRMAVWSMTDCEDPSLTWARGKGAAGSGEGKDSNSSGKWGGGISLLSPPDPQSHLAYCRTDLVPAAAQGGGSPLLCPGQELTEQQRALWAAFPREKVAGVGDAFMPPSHTPQLLR